MVSSHRAMSREQMIDAAIAQYLESVDAVQPLEPAALLARYPEIAPELEAFFRDRQHFQQALHALSPTPNPAVPLHAPQFQSGHVSSSATLTVGAAPPTDAPASHRQFGDYELLEEIARGGMGIVYKARQLSLSRTVALKMILAGPLAAPADVQRFHAEAEAAAHLDNPNIVPIYEVGSIEGHHFFSMKLIEGGSLKDEIERFRTQNASSNLPRERWAANMVGQVARAVHYAHQRGILHRDLKPANILLSVVGGQSFVASNQERLKTDRGHTTIPLVTDFGLAKRVESERGQTQTGAIVGTPSYMAPEQAAGAKSLTTAADVYSLGAILYELLTGQPPFRKATPVETIMQVLHEDAASPRTLDQRVDYDLETICLKCLQKEPDRRYRSAEELADDLDRWLRNEPIQARPSTRRERVSKWIRRSPARAALVGVSSIGLVAFVVVTALFNASLQRAQGEVSKKQQDVKLAQDEVVQLQAKAVATGAEADSKLTRATGLLLSVQSLVELPRSPGLALLLAIEGAQRFDSSKARNALYAALDACREERTLLGHEDGVRMVAYSRDGRRILTASTDKTARIWDAANGKELACLRGHTARIGAASFDADGRRVLTVAPYPERAARIWDAETGKEIVRMEMDKPFAMKMSVNACAGCFSPTGKLAATAFGDHPDWTVRIWNAETGKQVTIIKGHQGPVTCLEFSPDGKWLATGSFDRTARIWEVATGKELVSLQYNSCALGNVRFSHDGKRVLTVGNGEQYQFGPGAQVLSQSLTNENAERSAGRVWDAATGKLLVELTWPGNMRGSVAVALFSPDDRWIMTAGWRSYSVGLPGVPRLWDAATGKEVRSFAAAHERRDGSAAVDVAFSPDGKRLAVAGRDKTVRLWDVMTGQELTVFRGHEGAVDTIAFSPDGWRILTGSHDHTARVWDARVGGRFGPARGQWTGLDVAAFSPDGERLFTGISATSGIQVAAPAGISLPFFKNRIAQVWDLTKREAIVNCVGDQRGFARAQYSSTGDKVLTLSNLDGGVRLWETATGKELQSFRTTSKYGFSTASFSPDGKRIVTADGNGAGVIWNTATGKEELRLPADRMHPIYAAQFSPNGQRALTWAHGRVSGLYSDGVTAQVWDAANGALVATLKRPNIFVLGVHPLVRFSPDGKSVLAACPDRNTCIWDAESGKVLRQLRHSDDSLSTAAYSPDGRQIFVGTVNGVVQVWDATTGQQLRQVKGHEGQIRTIAFSPDGKQLATASADRTARIWDAVTGREVATLSGHEEDVNSAVFNSTGQWILTLTWRGTARLWPCDPLSAAIERKPRELTAAERKRFEIETPE